MTTRFRVAALVVAALLPMASCASIPERSDPTAVKPVSEGDTRAAATPPSEDLDSFGLVRNFVDTAAAPGNNHETARLHLARDQQRKWQVPSEMLIVDNVDTIPARSKPRLSDGVQTVRLQADKIGRFRADQSFVPEEGRYQVDVKVRQQPDGQWRLAQPPPDFVVSRTSFEEHYTPVEVYFLDHDYSGVVPDRRYVVSQPSSNLPRRVIDLLMMGPSKGFRSSMNTAIPDGVQPKTNPSEAADAALVVNLSDLKGASQQTKRLIAAQVVLSLESVSSARVRLLEESTPMLQDARDLRPADVSSYKENNAVSPDQKGLAIVDEKVHTLDQKAEPVPGSAGRGTQPVVEAGQSADGSRLATVGRTPDGTELRVGDYGGNLARTGVRGVTMTAPTWRNNDELWTVVNGGDLVRVIDRGGRFDIRRIDTEEFSGGKSIEALRLSHDGTRVVGLVDGQAVVAGVRDNNGEVTLEHPVTLTGTPHETRLTDVEWLDNESLAATTSEGDTAPVVEISVDGYDWKWYASSNLVRPLTAMTVTPEHNVVVVDGSGLWQASNPNELWSFVRVPIRAESIPFYPG